MPNDDTRLDALEVFFYSYINMYSTGTIVFPDKEKEAVGYIFYADTSVGKFKQIKDISIYAIKLTGMMKYISVKEFVNFVKAIYNNSSSWISEFVDDKFIHIDLIVVDKIDRGKGLATKIIKDVFEKADKDNIVTTLETQNPVNVDIYKRLGFKVVKEQKYESLTQYCMIRKPNTK